MGILRTNEISGLETPTAVTGSVLLGGPSSGDYLDSSSPEFAIGNTDFTIETWYNLASYPTNYYIFDLHTSGNGIRFTFYDGGTAGQVKTYWTTSTGTSYSSAVNEFTEINRWYHMSMTRKGTTVYAFMDGILQGTFTVADNFAHTNLRIGSYGFGASQGWDGYISNFRILKGTALYTENFTPPVHELQPIGDTVLLCCNNPDSAGAVTSYAGIGTSKTITVNGNAAASTVSPGLTRDFTYGTQFEGVAKFDTQGYFVPPSGTTEQRGRGRGVFTISSGTPANSNAINYLQISSTGNIQDFGDLTSVSGSAGSVSSSTRMVIALGNNSPVTASPGNVNTINYLTIATTSNALNFGDLTTKRGEIPGVSNSTRGVFIGGLNELVSPYGGPTINYTNTMDYISIASLGDAIDFGDAHTAAASHNSAVGNNTRGVYTVSWNGSTTVSNIKYITISTTGNGQDFGDLISPQNRQQKGSVSNSTRGLFAGGISPVTVNTIEYITITSLGNAQDFGDLSYIRRNAGGTSNSIRGVFAGGYDAPPGPFGRTNVIDYVILASTGNASDFGDLLEKSLNNTGASDSHGGIS